MYASKSIKNFKKLQKNAFLSSKCIANFQTYVCSAVKKNGYTFAIEAYLRSIWRKNSVNKTEFSASQAACQNGQTVTYNR